MTKCKRKSSKRQHAKSSQNKAKERSLKRLRREAVDVDFQGGTLTSDGGLLLLREADRKLDLIRRIDQAIPDPRT